jgi:hypothetical protein
MNIINKKYSSLFNVKKFKEDIHLNKKLSKNFNLNILIIFEASIFYFILWFQELWQSVFHFLGIFLR